MGLCPMSKLLRRGKYIIVFLLSLSVLAWIATFAGDTVRTPQDLSLLPVDHQTVSRDLAVKLVQVVPVVRSLSSPTHSSTEDHPEPREDHPEPGEDHPEPREDQQPKQDHLEPMEPCPEPSPLLKGAVGLSFEPSLTLHDVERSNMEVQGGQYRPSDCLSTQSVAILIPHRGREKHLRYLLAHLHPFLQRQQLQYGIYVIQQAGEATFNRAKLLNVGYLEALRDHPWDCFIFHDVDLVPENDHNLYTCSEQPRHLVVGRNATGYKLRYKGYFGGVTAMTKEQFHRVNGFSNAYWGWGGEDDDLRIRVELQKMKIVRPPADIARYTMVFHKRDSGNEINKDRMRLLGRTAQVWRKDGLNSCSYKTLSVERPPLYINVTVDIGKPH